jgi:hypothetical protein
MALNVQRVRRRPAPSGIPGPSVPGPPGGMVQPYDVAARFTLIGTPGNVVQDAVSISPEGAFVAVAIGYGFEEDRGKPLPLLGSPPESAVSFEPGSVTLAEIPEHALVDGFRVASRFQRIVFQSGTDEEDPVGVARGDVQLLGHAVPLSLRDKLFEHLKPSTALSFLFSIVDTATGRELQDEPLHNLSSLGKANGERPFRLLAQPLSFLPRSTIRFQVIERSPGARGTLFIVLYGYRVLAAAGCPEPLIRAWTAADLRMRAARSGPSPGVIPFDYAARLPLMGRPGRIAEDEVNVSTEGGFVATAVGYGLALDEVTVPVSAPGEGDTFSLAKLPLSAFPPSALLDGIRIRPAYFRLAFRTGGGLSGGLRRELASHVFERLNRVEDVSFRYTIADGGAGRELQNQAIHNIAGLGIADGDRPFKKLARPLVFQPRSTIRGTLFLVFQGYKLVGGAAGGARP